MTTIACLIAGTRIRIQMESLVATSVEKNFMDRFSRFFGGYVCTYTDEPHFTVTVTEPAHHFIRKRVKKTNYFMAYVYVQTGPTSFTVTYDISIHQLSHLFSYLVQMRIPQSRGFLLHASSANVGNKSIVFCGPSGEGKSTIAHLLKSRYPTLSDDISLIMPVDGAYVFNQMPDTEKNETIKKNKRSFRLGALCILHKSNEYRFKHIEDTNTILSALVPELRQQKQSRNRIMRNVMQFVRDFAGVYELYGGTDSQKCIDLIQRLDRESQHFC